MGKVGIGGKPVNESEQGPPRLDAIATRWSLLRHAHRPTDSAIEARNALVARYLQAIRRYVGALVPRDQEADDLAQDVVVRLLSGDFAGADPERGRFRDLLKVAIRNMVRNRWSHEKRRHGVELPAEGVASPQDAEAERCWVAEWRHRVLDLVWKALEQHERDRPGSVAYTVLRLRADYPEDTSEQLAARLSQKIGQPVTAETARQKLRRARLQLADLLISEVAAGLRDPTPEKTEDELIALGLMGLVRELLPHDWKSKRRER